MISFALSTAPGPSPQADASVSDATSVRKRNVCGGEIIVKLLTLRGNHTTAYREIA